MSPCSSQPRQRFRHQDRQRQRHRLGQRQRPADEVDLPQRRAGGRQELLPVQHPGHGHLVRDPRDARQPSLPLRDRRHHGGAERRDLRARPAGSGVGRLLHLRLHLAAAGADEARRHHRDRRAAGAAVQRELPGRAHAHPDEEHLLRGRASPRLCDLDLGRHPQAAGRDLCEEAAAGRLQHEGHPARLRLRHGRTSRARCRCASRRWTPRAATSSSTATPPPAWARLRRRHGRRLVPDHAVHVADGCVQGLRRASCASIRTPAARTSS